MLFVLYKEQMFSTYMNEKWWSRGKQYDNVKKIFTNKMVHLNTEEIENLTV